MTGKTISLLVLSGIHTGARAGLAKHETEIGHSDDSDLIFSDQHIEAHHCRVVLKDGKILIHRQDGEVFLYGKSVDKAEVPVGTVFTVADVQIAVVDENTDISTLSAEKMPPRTGDGSADTMMSPYESNSIEPTISDLDLEPDEEEAESIYGMLVRHGSGRSAIVGAGILFVIVLALLAWEAFYVFRQPGAVVQDPDVFVEYMAHEYPDFTVEQIMPKGFTVAGTVVSQQEKQRILRDAREKFGFSFIWRIDVIDDLLIDLREQIAFYGANLAVSYDNKQINVRGYVGEAALLKELKDNIKVTTDIPINWHILSAYELEQGFAKAFKEQKVTTKVEYQWLNNRVRLTTLKTEDDQTVQRQLADVGKRVERNLNIPLWVNYEFIDPPPAAPTVAATNVGLQPGVGQQMSNASTVKVQFTKNNVTQVATGVIPYVVLVGGERLFIGAEIGDGFKITAITDGGITLSNGEETKIVTLD